MTKLRTILRYLGTCDGDMEKGNLRADVNVSVRQPGEPLGTRCEIKNVNSIRFIGQAIEVEARRQIDIIEDGGKIDQETRLFDPGKGETRSMRSKEEAHDYRYFPDPDLLPLEFDQAYVDDLDTAPAGAARREEGPLHAATTALPAYDAGVLVAERDCADFFEAVAKGRDGKAAANWVINELFGRLNKEGKDIDASAGYRPRSSAPSSISSPRTPSPARSPRICSRSSGPKAATRAEIVEARGMKQVTDTGAIEKAVDEIIAANPDKVEQAKAKPTMLGWFVGQVMKPTGGKANPQAVNEILKKKLGIE